MKKMLAMVAVVAVVAVCSGWDEVKRSIYELSTHTLTAETATVTTLSATTIGGTAQATVLAGAAVGATALQGATVRPGGYEYDHDRHHGLHARLCGAGTPWRGRHRHEWCLGGQWINDELMGSGALI